MLSNCSLITGGSFQRWALCTFFRLIFLLTLLTLYCLFSSIDICYLVCFNTNFILGVGNLQRSSSQRSTLTYQRNNYALNTTATYAEPYRSMQYRLSESGYNRLQHAAPADDGTTRSPSIDSIQKDPRQVHLCFENRTFFIIRWYLLYLWEKSSYRCHRDGHPLEQIEVAHALCLSVLKMHLGNALGNALLMFG